MLAIYLIVQMSVPVSRYAHSLFVLVFIINRSFILFTVWLFVLFHFHWCLLVLLLFEKRKRTILIMNRVQVFRSRSIPCYLFNIIIIIIMNLFISLYLLLFVSCFYSLFDYFVSFSFEFCFDCCSKREKNNSDPELCSGISILRYPLQVTRTPCSTSSSSRVNKHHTADSTNFVLV
jgi:hypothetical protein